MTYPRFYFGNTDLNHFKSVTVKAILTYRELVLFQFF